MSAPADREWFANGRPELDRCNAVKGRRMTQLPAITTWPAATRERVAAAILDAALPTPSPAGDEVTVDWAYVPSDVLFNFLVERVGPALPLLKMIFGADDEPTALVESPPSPLPDDAKPARKPRKPTLASVAKQARKARINASRYEVKPDRTIAVVVGEPELADANNPWLADNVRKKK